MENKMKSFKKLSALILPLAFITGCANTAHNHSLDNIDITAIKDHFNKVEAHIGKIETHLGQVENTADTALTTARSAQNAADDANTKVDRMFHKAMSK